MRKFFQKFSSAALVVGGFLVVFFGSSKFASNKSELPPTSPITGGSGVARADAPYSQGYYQGYYQSYYEGYYQGSYSGDSSGSGSGDSCSGDSCSGK